MSENISENINIVWFKRDLRLHDHAPLFEAAQAGQVLPLYIVEPNLWQQPDISRKHWYFLYDSLQDLNQQLSTQGGQLIIKVGEVIEVLEDLRQNFGGFTLWSHEETGNAWTFKRDIAVAKWCQQHQVMWHEHPSHGVVRRLKNRDNWAAIRNQRMAQPVLDIPLQINFIDNYNSEILPPKDHPLFGAPLQGTAQAGGRQQGLKVLQSFLNERAQNYMRTISKPGVSARHCSRLSAHIAYGTLSVREIEQATKARIVLLQQSTNNHDIYFAKNLTAFLSRLAWRCHFVQKLEQQPKIETQCMHPNFEGMREPHFRQDYFDAWKNGTTGYPLIDACMRSLIDNGWLTFRMRAMLVSFASYHLWLDWRQTAPYLAKLFTDYEPGIHYAQFQMQSGVTGINAIRIYNPIKQSQEHDPTGKFIRRYVPELASVPDAFIHEPWRWTNPPIDYPKPIVDNDMAMKQARARITEYWRATGFKEQAQKVYQKLGSRSKLQRQTTPIKPKTLPNQMSFTFDE